MAIRKPAVAGYFYPADSNELLDMLDALVPHIENANKSPIALVVPHAGYIYSGPFAGKGYALLRSYKNRIIPPTVWVLAPSHFYPFRGVSVGPYTHWETPLGVVPVSPKVQKLLYHAPQLITDDPLPHVREHSLEVQLPFLQYVLGDFYLVPLSFGDVDITSIGNVIMNHLDPEDIIIISTDLSHYYPDHIARQLDKVTLELALSGNWEELLKREACGRYPWATGVYIANQKRWKPQLIAYGTSADTAGDKDSVVGYATISYFNY